MEFNWMAIGAAIIAQMAIGYLYFHPSVMGNKWAAANGKTLDEMKPENMGLTMGLTILFTFLFTTFLAVNVTGPGQEAIEFHTIKHGLFHALVLAITVVMPMFGTQGMYEKRSWNWIFIQTGYWFSRMAVAQAILSFWR